eukprot:6843743-Prymnesium_polylepis.1
MVASASLARLTRALLQHYMHNGRAPQLQAGRERFSSEVQRARSEAAARRAEAAAGAAGRWGSGAARHGGAGGVGRQGDGAPLGADGSPTDSRARLVGNEERRPHLEISAPGVSYDMSWLDELDASLLATIDAIRPHECDIAHRAEYHNMLHLGLKYALQHGGAAAGTVNFESRAESRGFKFNILAKTVTVGRLPSEGHCPSVV